MELTFTYNQSNAILRVLELHVPSLGYLSESFLHRRLPDVCNKLHVNSASEIEQRIIADSTYIDKILALLVVPTTEMFRDVQVWKILLETLLPKLSSHKPCNVWFPDSSSGEEIFSFCILLKELQLTNYFTIYATSSSLQTINTIKKGIFSLKQEQIFRTNYKNVGLSQNFEMYYSQSLNSIYMNPSLLQNVTFIHSKSLIHAMPKNIHLVMFRNSLLYFSQSMHHIVISRLHKQIELGGYLLLGLQDSRSIFEFDTLFEIDNKEERIYRKK